jgi:ATP-dependent DNA helicase RecQ
VTNPKNKYKSDLDIFIRESKLEDFSGENMETIFVSTMHKAKGREFDNVFLMLDDFSIEEDGDNRLLYVAMTRAKNNLTIHYDGSYLETITADDLRRVSVEEIYPPPNEFAMQMTHKDVALSYFTNCQPWISQLNSGDELRINGASCLNLKGIPVLKFSKQRRETIEGLKRKNYIPKKARIRFIVYWKGEDMEKEIKILLPELHFERAEGGE